MKVHFNYAIYTRHILDYPYALLVPSIFEEFFLLQILLTTGLNALTQILLQGRVTRALLGAGAAALPDLDEDFGVALIRIGTYSIAATSTIGLGNEVAEVCLSADRTFVKLERNNAAVHGPMMFGNSRPGLSNEIKGIKVEKSDAVRWPNTPWMNEMKRFSLTVWRALKRAFHGRRNQKNSPGPDIRTSPVGAPVKDGGVEELTVEHEMERKYVRAYTNFLRGDPITDDEDEPYEEGSSSHSDADEDADEDGDDEPPQVGEVDDTTSESTQLLLVHAAESSRRANTPTPLAPILLAHFTSPDGYPLTRRGYSDLILSHSSATAPVQNGPHSRHRQLNDQDGAEPEDGRHLCVICWSADRSIICWPCRCLAMCDDCRANIASRSTATRHTCPCCKQGYVQSFA